MTIRVLDIESTGIDPAADAVIEVASVDLLRGGGIANAMQTFVDPGRPIPPVASAVHHLLDEDLVGAPKMADAIERFKGADVYVAHNSGFEQSFLSASGIDLGPWLCTYKCALRVWPDFGSHSNQALRYQLGLSRPFDIPREQISPHRAASDVIVTAAILEVLVSMAPWADLMAWSQEPALYTRFDFGKHVGQRYDAHPDYLEWMLRQTDMDAGKKFSAEYWLKRGAANG